MATIEDVAEWMKAELDTSVRLYQERIVTQIKNNFGDEFGKRQPSAVCSLRLEVGSLELLLI